MIRLFYGLVGLLALLYQRVVNRSENTPPGQTRLRLNGRPAVNKATKPPEFQTVQDGLPPIDWQKRKEEAGRPPADWIERVEKSRDLDWNDYEAGQPQRSTVPIQAEVRRKGQSGPAGKPRFLETKTAIHEEWRWDKKTGLRLKPASPPNTSKDGENRPAEPARRHAQVIHEIKTSSDSLREIEQEFSLDDKNLKTGRDEKKTFKDENTSLSRVEPVRINHPTVQDCGPYAPREIKSQSGNMEAVDRFPQPLIGQFPPAVEAANDRRPFWHAQSEEDRTMDKSDRFGFPRHQKPLAGPDPDIDGHESGPTVLFSKQLPDAPLQPPVTTSYPPAQDKPSQIPTFNEMSRLWPELPDEDWGDNRGLDAIRQEQEHLHRLDREQRGL